MDRTASIPYNHPTLKVLTAALPPHLRRALCDISLPFLFLPFRCNPITNHPDRVHFSPLRGCMKIKKQSKMGHRRHPWLWFMMAGTFCGSLQPGSSTGRLPLPQPSNGELQSAHSDTVKPSGAADYGAKYWSLPHMCQNSPHPLIRISPSRHTGTNRIY